jgi:hypothetical protein
MRLSTNSLQSSHFDSVHSEYLPQITLLPGRAICRLKRFFENARTSAPTASWVLGQKMSFRVYALSKLHKMRRSLMLRKTLLLAMVAGAALLVAGPSPASASLFSYGGGCGGGCGGCGGYTSSCGCHHHHVHHHHHGCGCGYSSCGCGAPVQSCGCGAPAPTCCAPAPTCAAPAPMACAPPAPPTCAAPAPTCCAPAAPTCAAPAAPTCAAPGGMAPGPRPVQAAPAPPPEEPAPKPKA